MYQIEKKNNEELEEFYEKKLQNWQHDHKLLVNKYENHIVNITTEIQQLKTASFVSKPKKSIRKESINDPFSDPEYQ